MQPHPVDADPSISRLFGLVHELAGLGVWHWEVTGDAVTWSDGLYRIYGLSPESFAPTLETYLTRVFPDDRERVAQLLEHAVHTHDRFDFEQRIVRPDGTVRTLESVGTVVRDADGSPLRVLGACMDVTERRALNEHVAKQDRLAALGTLAAGVAHEVNNPLLYVRAGLQQLQDSLGDPRNPEVTAVLDDMRAGVDKMAKIIDDLRTHQLRSTNGNPRAVCLADVVGDVLSLVDHQLSHRARLGLDLDRSVFVRADPDRLGQVLINLLTNAAQAIPPGRAATNEVRITVGREDTSAVLRIQDTGAGIPEGHLARLFEPFFTTKPVGEGTGLGLFIVHREVARVGGTIELLPASPGTVAIVRIPAATPTDDAERASSADLPHPEPAPTSVLVVDDDDLVGRALRRLLKDRDVHIVDSSAKALDYLEQGARPDFILCDLMMPDGPGHELYADIVDRWPALASRVRFITGGVFEAEMQAFARTHQDRILHKPFSRDQLLALLSPR